MSRHGSGSAAIGSARAARRFIGAAAHRLSPIYVAIMPTLPVAVDLKELEHLAWNVLFGDNRPVEIEIGCGKAGFLLRRAGPAGA